MIINLVSNWSKENFLVKFTLHQDCKNHETSLIKMQSGFRAETRPWSPWRPWCQLAQQQPELLQLQLPPRSHLGPSFVNTEGFLFNSTDLIMKNKFYILEDQQPASGCFTNQIPPVKTNVRSERLHCKPKLSSNYPKPDTVPDSPSY